MARSKGLSPGEIANLLREISECESDGGELSSSSLDSNEDIRLNESYCGESEERIVFLWTVEEMWRKICYTSSLSHE
ncbi:hypothetical protein TNCV_4112051 [Trichonephila clavipes]|nr:hypothetical protein TNCV_4112051 [Trichonephila clavipes]